MGESIKYNREYQVSCNKISIDLLKLLDRFLIEKGFIPKNILTSHVFFKYENCTIHTDTLSELLNKEQFVLNIDKDFSLYLDCCDRDSESNIHLSIKRIKDKIRIYGTINNIEEHITIGQKEILEKFLKDNFIEEKVVEKETNNNEQAENNITIVKKSLEWDIPSIKLYLDDLIELESLLKQDITNVEEYAIKLEPNEKYLQKRTNAPKYIFKSAMEFKTHNDLLEEIDNYSINFEFRTPEIQVNFKFSDKNLFPDKLYANGENQTLYYGKYKLLTDYLNTKKNWYYWIYFEHFRYFLYPIILSIITYITIIMFVKTCINIQIIEALKIFLFYVIFLILFFNTTKVLKKYKFSFIKKNIFEKMNLYNIALTIIIGLGVNLLTPYFQCVINKFYNILKNLSIIN